MEGFAMSYLAPQMSLSNVTAADPLDVPLLPLDSLDHQSNYDAETFAGSDDAPFGQHAIQPPPLQRFPSAYEDPFSDGLQPYEQQAATGQTGPESPSIDRDNKLLSFSPPKYSYTLLDYAYRRTSISLSAQLHGMFFLAESPWASAGDISNAPTELTCYRRNLFQITGNITMPRNLQYVMADSGEQIPVLGQELTISATESVEGNSVKIISVPWKTPTNSTAIVEDKTEKEPPSISLDLSQDHDMDSEYVNFPIAWKRLQFRIATANNGRRKELQQHFVVKLKVIATLSTGNRVSLCEVHSGAIIVRGRSPRNFQSRKDLPISAGGSAIRKSSHVNQSPRNSAGESTQKLHQTQDRSDTKSAIDISQLPFSYDANDLQIAPEFFEWKVPTGGQAGAMTAIPPDPPSFKVPEATPYAQSSPDLSRNPQASRVPPTAPISLSLTEDEPKKSASPAENTKKIPKLNPVRAPSFSLNLVSSPDESADLLYEYFPLGLDDWMPPVDAVYRPHVVHHTNLPQDPKAIAVKNKSKRYFSEDKS